ncbi:hypothetical protein C8R47DRAFT_765202 [Mycena vitilis]|nr:hypothetical protein C8R47DRAFT_765202 [Mycena vitilis]
MCMHLTGKRNSQSRRGDSLMSREDKEYLEHRRLAIAPAGQIMNLTANVWNRHKGNPLHPRQKPEHFKGKFPQGTYVFPFEMPPLPKFVSVTHPDNDTRKTKGFVPLPPSGKINYTVGQLPSHKHLKLIFCVLQCGVGVRRDSVNGMNEDMDMILQYIPLMRAPPRPRTPFPFLASREDWPFERETLGGWVLTPFGGRGRIGTQTVEVEGILGVQAPAVYTAGQTLEFELLLWSKSAEALQLLGQPAAVSVGYYKADFMPSSEALRPREQSRQTRTLERMAEGRAWVAGSGRPRGREPVPELVSLDLGTSVAPKGKRPGGSRMQSWSSENDQATTETGDGEDAGEDSIDALDDGEETGHFQRLAGEVRIPACRPVSYRYTEIGREYSLQLHLAHPQYAHISPTGPGLVAEVPIWYVADRTLNAGPSALNDNPAYLAVLPLKGATISAGADAVRWPRTMGERATQARGGKAKFGQPFIGLVPPARAGS